MTLRQHSKQFIHLVKALEGRYAKQIFLLLHNQTKQAADIIEQQGVQLLRHNLDSILMIDGLAEVIRELYKQVGLWGANRTMRMINASVERKAGFGFDEKWIREIINYFQLYLLTKAVIPISEETKLQILQILSDAEKNGWGIDVIAEKLRSPELVMWRARMIARTEINKAHFYGQQLAQQDSEYETTKTWVAAHDHRTRHSHRDVDGTKINSNERFRVPVYRGKLLIGYDNMKAPGDPEASAGNVINCRCTTVVRAARDERGRIIRKNVGNSRISVILPNQRRNITQVVTI